MKIENSNLSALHNEEHFQFHTQFTNLVREHTAEILKISEPFENSYLPCYQRENESIKLILKSSFTEILQKMDEERDRVALGLVQVIKAHINHPEPEVVKAAKRLKIVVDAYGKMYEKSYNKETAAIYNLVQDLTGAYSADATMLNLDNWIAGLDNCNQQFEGLEKERYLELMERTDLRMETIREEIDPIYQMIVERINALIIIEGEAAYARFVEEHNLHIEHYKTIIAQRRGRAQARRDKEENENNEPGIEI